MRLLVRRRAVITAMGLLVPTLLVAQAELAQKPVYPASDRAWNAADYRDLNELIKSGKAPLPTLADPVSRPVFERLVNLQNLEIARSKSLPIGSRLQEILGMFDVTRTLVAGYIAEAQKGKPYERELAKVQVYLLAQSSVILDVVNEFLPTIPKDNKYQARMAGFEKMKQGMRTIMAGVIESTSETGFYSKESTLELVQGIITYLPSMQPVLTDQDRQDFAPRWAPDGGHDGFRYQSRTRAPADGTRKVLVRSVHCWRCPLHWPRARSLNL
jgi:hypothetical protein